MPKLQVWWIPQVPMQPFRVDVTSLAQAKFLMNTLAAYDNFQYENNIKPDYCNAGGLEVFENGEWSDWYDDESGCGIDDISMEEAMRLDEVNNGK